jgi:flagellar biosynthesis protein
MSGPSRERRSAAGLRYEGRDAPRVIATGRGHVADRIVALAKENGIPVKEDPVLAEALAVLELDHEVPPELYQAVAETLLWAYRLSKRSTPGRRGR